MEAECKVAIIDVVTGKSYGNFHYKVKNDINYIKTTIITTTTNTHTTTTKMATVKI